MAVQPSRTVTDSRNFMHLLTPEQLQLERNHSKKEMTRLRGEALVAACLELPARTGLLYSITTQL